MRLLHPRYAVARGLNRAGSWQICSSAVKIVLWASFVLPMCFFAGVDAKRKQLLDNPIVSLLARDGSLILRQRPLLTQLFRVIAPRDKREEETAPRKLGRDAAEKPFFVCVVAPGLEGHDERCVGETCEHL